MRRSAIVLLPTSFSRALSIQATTSQSNKIDLVASRLGLNPSQNRFHAPLVYHEDYSFDGWPEKHTFPMGKFARLAHALTHKDPSSSLPRPLVRQETDFFRPIDPPIDWFSPIDADFLDRFLQGQLDEEECRYIGFRQETSRPELIRRTVLEVAGTVLTAQLACWYGVAANLAGGTHHAHPMGGAG
jgi:acetoin utilization deacetylase AcuC-like enzyme